MKRKKRLILIAILATISTAVWSAVSDMILHNHPIIPEINYPSVLGNDYILFLCSGLLMLISFAILVITGYELSKDIIKARGVENG